MKKFIITSFCLLLTCVIWAQNRSANEYPHNEVNINIANTIAIASVEVGYEYFFDYNQSVGAKVLINDRINYHSENGSDKFNTNSFRVNYTYYFGEYNPGSGVYVQPFLKYRFGDFEEKVTLLGSTPMTQKTDMDSFIIGVGLGYEWNFSNSFVVGPFANFGRNFSDDVKDRFSAFEFNAGINIGYRF